MCQLTTLRTSVMPRAACLLRDLPPSPLKVPNGGERDRVPAGTRVAQFMRAWNSFPFVGKGGRHVQPYHCLAARRGSAENGRAPLGRQGAPTQPSGKNLHYRAGAGGRSIRQFGGR